jgi:hypothetical protein
LQTLAMPTQAHTHTVPYTAPDTIAIAATAGHANSASSTAPSKPTTIIASVNIDSLRGTLADGNFAQLFPSDPPVCSVPPRR